LKLATLLLWAFGDSFFDQWSTDGAPDSEDSVITSIFWKVLYLNGNNFKELGNIFEHGEVAAGTEELKQSEASAAALVNLLNEIGPDKINTTLDEKVHWIPLCCLQRPVTCREILRKAKCQLPVQLTHFMDYQHQSAVLNKMKFNEVEGTGIFNYV
jgi:hypothetical protein